MKMFKVLVAALAMAAIVTPAIASDLTLSGTMEVRGHFVNVDTAGTDSSESYNYQRLRTAGSYSVADGVSVNFRFDVTESPENGSGAAAWGSAGQFTQRRADIQYDLAYLQLVKNGVTFQAGELYTGRFGTGQLSDILGAGFVVKYDAATLYHIKVQEDDVVYGGGNGLDSSSVSGLAYVVKGEGFTLTPNVAYSNSGGSDADVFGAQLSFTADAGPVALAGEFTMFDGENAAGADVKGEQIFLDISTAASDNTTVGAHILWGNAQDGGDVQMTTLGTVFGGWSPFQYGHNETDFDGDLQEFAIAPNAGMRYAQLYVNSDVSEDLNVMAAVGYGEADDDDIADVEATVVNASAAYKFMPNTTLKFSANYIDMETAGVDTEWTQGIAGVYVKF